MHNKSKQLSSNNIYDSIERHINFYTLQTIYAGFSGGADSTALIVILKNLSIRYKFKLTAVHFEHGLRGTESTDDALWCKDFCQKQKIRYIEFKIVVKDSLQLKEGIETCARRLRLEKLASIVTSDKDAIALGHHKDDQIENLLLRLIRGSNCSGLTSLRHSTILGGINILRPLLNLSKQEIETFLSKNNIANWRIDSTNEKNIYRRNIIRNNVLPVLYQSIPESKAGILRAEEALKDDAEFLEYTSKAEYKKHFTKTVEPSYLSKLDRRNQPQLEHSMSHNKNEVASTVEFPKTFLAKTLLKMHVAIRARVLRYWLTDLLKFEFIPNRDLLKRIEYELKRYPKEEVLIPLSKDLFLKLERGCLSLSESNNKPDLKPDNWNWKVVPKIQIGCYSLESKIVKEVPNRINRGEICVYFDSSLLPDTLHLRPWKEGDRFTPFGSDKSVKVKRIFKNKKISPTFRKQIPLLCLPDGTIIWVVGLKRSNFAVIDKIDTKIALFTVCNIEKKLKKYKSNVFSSFYHRMRGWRNWQTR
jgi:tRNA(Ile)-lysidine synthase